MTLVHTQRGAKRYRYYLSRPARRREGEPLGSLPRISAGVLESFLIPAIEARLTPGWRPGAEVPERVRDATQRVAISADEVRVTLRREAARADLVGHHDGDGGEDIAIRLPIVLKRREGAILIAADRAAASPGGKVDRTLIRAVVLARAWAQDLANGRYGSVKELAEQHGLCPSRTMRLAPLAYLAPDIVTMILEGRQPAWLSLKTLTAPLPLDWREQRERLLPNRSPRALDAAA